MSTRNAPKAQPPDILFVVLCRICEIGDKASDWVGTAQQLLAEICADQKKKNKNVYQNRPSVYGRFLCLKEAGAAIEAATAVLDRAALEGIRLAIGIDEQFI